MKRLGLLCTLGSALLIFAGSPAFSGTFDIDFETDPGLMLFGDAEMRATDGNPDGYLKITDAANGERGAVVFPDLDGGAIITGFSIGADLRVGGGTDRPADGFSFNFARAGDPVLDDGEDWAASPTGEGNLPEEGTTTGLAIGFDEWFSGGTDTIGMSVRIDDVIVAEIPIETLNGELSDITSLQTGPRGPGGPGDTSELGWARLGLLLEPCEFPPPVCALLGSDARQLSISWKGNEVFKEALAYPASAGQLVFGGRTGGANAAHHIDNISVTTVPEPGSMALAVTGLGFFALRRRRRHAG